MKNNKGYQRFNSSKKKKKKKKQNPLSLDSSTRTAPVAVAAPSVPASSSATAAAPAAAPAPAPALASISTINPTPMPLSASTTRRIISCFHGYGPVLFSTNAKYLNACGDLSERVAEAIENTKRSAATTTKNGGGDPNAYSDCTWDVIQNFLNADSTLDLKHFLDAMVYKNTEMLLMKLSDADDNSADRALIMEAVRFDATIIIRLLSRMALIDARKRSTTETTTTGTIRDARSVVSMHQDVVRIMDCDKEVIRFFDKRIPCNCLKPLLGTASTDERGACELPTCSVKAGDDGGRSLFLCGGCHSTKYCSKECQRKHWADHKAFCREWQEVHNQVQAVLFDESKA